MSEDKLNELFLLYVYRDIKLGYKKIVELGYKKIVDM